MQTPAEPFKAPPRYYLPLRGLAYNACCMPIVQLLSNRIGWCNAVTHGVPIWRRGASPFVPVGADDFLVIRGRDGNGQEGCVVHLGNAPQNPTGQMRIPSFLSPRIVPALSSKASVFVKR